MKENEMADRLACKTLQSKEDKDIPNYPSDWLWIHIIYVKRWMLICYTQFTLHKFTTRSFNRAQCFEP